MILLFAPREILMRKEKTEVVDMMFWLVRGSIVGLISKGRGHEEGDREIWEARKVLPEFVSSVKQDQGCDIRLALQLMVWKNWSVEGWIKGQTKSVRTHQDKSGPLRNCQDTSGSITINQERTDKKFGTENIGTELGWTELWPKLIFNIDIQGYRDLN